MGDMFRSEEMALCQLFLQPEAAFQTISELGEIGCAQFCDLNEKLTLSQRKFVNEVRRCEEMERQMRFIETEMNKDDMKLFEITENLPIALNPRNVVNLETELEKVETELIELSENEIKIKTNFLELTELLKVLENTQGFFSDKEVLNLDSNNFDVGTGKSTLDDNRGQLAYVAGVINRERVFAFERMLWRVTRGNVFVKQCDLDETLNDPKTGNPIYKTVFVAFFQGEQLKTRVKKVCTGFRASIYTCPSSHTERFGMIQGVLTRLEDMKLVLSQSKDHRHVLLGTVSKNVPSWIIMVQKMKAIYHILNCFNIDVTEKCLIGECWVPKRDLNRVQAALITGAAAVGSTIPAFLNVIETKKSPPTYYRTNKFTRGFQALIDSYGVANYREVNPALYTCITFPFLFAIMFGDMGHGFIMFLFGLYMVIAENGLSKKRGGGEIWRIMFSGRYIILLMGLFAMYTGFTYNDLFSKSLNVFGSKWRIRYNISTVENNPDLTLDPKYDTVGVYPLGLDPIWQLADNQIIFTNTFKMKLSIILGIVHMTLGICLSVVNYVYFKKYASILLEFLPQIIFLFLLFGYMVFMMFYKFVKYSATTDIETDTPGCAPSVLIMFINMVLFKEPTHVPGCDDYMFPVQRTLETIFVVVALLCIPWMLFGIPVYIQIKRKMQRKQDQDIQMEVNDFKKGKKDFSTEVEFEAATNKDLNDIVEEIEDEEEEPMSEVYIHQAIHTIEYVLSTVSHTASYLRLWALSLAHAQLSSVLWSMVMSKGLILHNYVGCILVFCIFAVWAVLTVAIMIMMEGLSAFLHTLRLHWVELMSKFYTGQGYAFQPFSFAVILSEEDED